MKRHFLSLALAAFLIAPASAQSIIYPVVQVQSGVRTSGTLERDANGTLWLRTTDGKLMLVSGGMTYLDTTNNPVAWTALQPGKVVTVELPTGETRVVAVGRDTVTLLTPRGISQVPTVLLPTTTLTTAMVDVRYPDGKVIRRPLAEAVTLTTSNQAVVVLPDPSYAVIATPTGLVTVNLMPFITFKDDITEYGTVQKKDVIQGTQEVYVLTGRGENLAVPVKYINDGSAKWDDVKIGDRVSVNIPENTTVQLREMYGKEAQFKTADGQLIQLPFKVLPDSALRDTRVGVRRLNGEIETQTLEEALKENQSRAHTILLPGVPGVTYTLSAAGIYDLRLTP